MYSIGMCPSVLSSYGSFSSIHISMVLLVLFTFLWFYWSVWSGGACIKSTQAHSESAASP